MDNAYSASTPSNWVTLYVSIFTFGILLLYITLFWLNLVFEEKLSLANRVGVSCSIAQRIDDVTNLGTLP